MPAFQAASSVPCVSFSETGRKRFPRGAVPMPISVNEMEAPEGALNKCFFMIVRLVLFGDRQRVLDLLRQRFRVLSLRHRDGLPWHLRLHWHCALELRQE